MRKTIFITGATDGIGLLTAQKLIAEGHQVLLHGRHPDKLNRISASLDGAPAYCAALSVIDEVTSLSSALFAEYQQLDVLINNDGVLKTTYTQTKHDRDGRFAINTFSPNTLTPQLTHLIPTRARLDTFSTAA